MSSRGTVASMLEGERSRSAVKPARYAWHHYRMRYGLCAVGLAVTAIVTSLSAQGEQPLPPAEEFLAKAREHLASNALLQRRYRYKERQTDLKLNPFGQMGTGPIEVFQVFPAAEDDMTYRRLIERDGQPVPARELAKQDREYADRYKDWQQELAAEGTTARDARVKRDAAMRRKEQAQAKELIGLFDFSLVRREVLRGEPAIVVRFTPRPGGRASSREARVAHAFAGEAWIHETEYEVMQLEGTSRESVAFGFGVIARLNEGAKVRISRKRTLGVWLPDETRFTGGGRALLVRRVDLEYVRQYFDYEPFDPTAPPPIPGLGGSGRP
jgi:hypothetical protein